MTGYGASSSGNGKNKINAELKALNGKFFELKIRGLDINFNLSKTIKDYLFKNLNRGSVYLHLESSKISLQDNVSLNSVKFELLNDIVEQINKKYKKSLNLNHLLRINDFISISSEHDISDEIILNVVKKSCKNLIKMRKIEGESLKKDILSRIKYIDSILLIVKKTIKEDNRIRFQKYQKKIESIVNQKSFETIRLHQEVAILAEKSDVTEEIVRLTSHLKFFKSLFRQNQPVGRKLSFTLQEILREVNTLGSKASNEATTRNVIEIKEEIEKIKEQVLNIL
tara:strand:- start:6002 stop:6850 length:849 start_codon:yes stop_codon:yes gene_type:complete